MYAHARVFKFSIIVDIESCIVLFKSPGMSRYISFYHGSTHIFLIFHIFKLKYVILCIIFKIYNKYNYLKA